MRKLFLIVILCFILFFPLYSASEAHQSSVNVTHKMTLLVIQLAIIIIVSRITGFIFSRYLKQPRVLGELAAGMIIGPYALGGIDLPLFGSPLFPIPEGTLPVSPELYGFAIIASIILLFMAGLETDLPTFLRFSLKGSLVGLGGVVISFFLGDMAAVLFLPGVNSFMNPTALFLGTLSTATSVGITARILSENKKMSSPEGVTILAAAVLDDVIGIVLLAVVVGISRVSGTNGSVKWAEIGIIAAKAFGFWLICTLIGILVAPRLTKGLKRFQSMDIIASIAFGIALILAGLSEMAGLAMIIGAYVIGLSLSQTDIAHEIRESMQGIYQFFVPVFFVVMGMMVNFAAMKNVLVFGLIYTAIAIIGKLAGCGLPALLVGFNLRGAFRIGAGMLPRGEVTLIVAGIGLSSGVIGADMFGVAIMTLLAASIVAPPLLVKSFKGGSGYRARLKVKPAAPLKTIELEFPSDSMASFIRKQILKGFRNADFFIQHVNFQGNIYHLRKDEVLLTLIQKEKKIILNTAPEHEPFVRLLMLGEVLTLKDLLRGLESMKSPDYMGAELLRGIFADEESRKD